MARRTTTTPYTTGFVKVPRGLLWDPRFMGLTAGAQTLLLYYLSMTWSADGGAVAVVDKRRNPLSLSARADIVGRSRGAVIRLEAELADAGFITVETTSRGAFVRLSVDAEPDSEQDQTRLNLSQVDDETNMTQSESGCELTRLNLSQVDRLNLSQVDGPTRLNLSQVADQEPKGPLASSGSVEGVDVEGTPRRGGAVEGENGPPESVERSSTATADGHGNGAGAQTGEPVAADGKQRTATAPLSETTRGTTEATATGLPLAELVQQVTGTRPTSEKNAELVAGIVASRKATEAELRLALVECRPEASEYAREWMPRAEHWCQERRAANLRRLVSETIGRLNAAPNVAARWEIMQEVWSAHEELRPPREGEGRNQALESVQEATGFTAVNDWGLEQALRDEQGEAWMATHPEWAAMAEQRAADAQEERSRRFRERMAETMRQIQGGNAAP